MVSSPDHEIRQKCLSIMEVAKQLGVQLRRFYVEDNKVCVEGEAPSADVGQKLRDQIRMAPPCEINVAAEIAVNPALARTEATRVTGASNVCARMHSYTVRFGDTLWKISKQFYGTSTQYMRIFEANLDEFEDPNRILPGQTLKIPM
jgi:nucleoid-associated protein YgaU